MIFQHGQHLEGRAGQHQNMDAVCFEGTAGGSAHGVIKHGAADRQLCLLKIVLRHFHVNIPLEIAANRLEDVFVEDQRLSEGLADGLLGHVIIGGAKATGGDDNIGSLSGNCQSFFQTLGIIADDSMPEHIHADGGQSLRDILCIGVGNVAQQQFSADGDDLCGM